MMFRASVLGQLGGLDERFFYHFEEVDLCFRTWEAGVADCLLVQMRKSLILGGSLLGRFPV